MKISEKLIENYDAVKELLKAFQIKELRIFGSVACGQDKSTSDLDILIDMPDDATLLQYGLFKYKLETLLEAKTDVLTFRSFNDATLNYFKDNSITLEQLISKTYIKSNFTEQEKLNKNLNSMIWVIDRILSRCEGISKAFYMSDEGAQDFITRNIQLLSQVASQLQGASLEYLDSDTLNALIVLKDALFMNVDQQLQWTTMNEDLPIIKRKVQKALRQ